jgi:hypothetical protein
MKDKKATEYWTNESGRDIPTRDAKPGEGFSVTVWRKEAEKQKKFAGNVYWCVVAQKTADRVGIGSEAEARFFGHAVLTTIGFVAVGPDAKGKRIRLRYFHDGRKVTTAFDNGQRVDSVQVTFRPPSRSQKKESIRQFQAEHRERIRLGMVTPTGHKKYAPSRSGAWFNTHEKE